MGVVSESIVEVEQVRCQAAIATKSGSLDLPVERLLSIRNELERLLHPNEKDVFAVNQKAL